MVELKSAYERPAVVVRTHLSSTLHLGSTAITSPATAGAMQAFPSHGYVDAVAGLK